MTCTIEDCSESQLVHNSVFKSVTGFAQAINSIHHFAFVMSSNLSKALFSSINPRESLFLSINLTVASSDQ